MTGPTFSPAAPSVVHRPAPAPPRPTAPARPALTRPDGEGGGSRVFVYLRLHWLTILFLGGLIGAALAYAAWSLMPPKYESYALFQVSSAPSYIASASDPTKGKTEFNTYLKTTASLFKTEFVYTRALADLRDNATLAAQKEPMKFLDQELSVESKEGSEIIKLVMKGTSPDDVRAIVDAMTKSYVAQVVERERNVKVKFRDDLQKQKTELDNIIKGMTQPGMPGGPQGLKPDGIGPDPQPGQPAAPGAAPNDPDFLKRAMFPELVKKAVRLREELPEYDLRIDRLKAGIAATKTAMQQLLDTPVSADAQELAKKDLDYLQAKAHAERKKAEYTKRSASVVDPNSQAMTVLKLQAEAAQTEAEGILTAKAKSLELERRKPLFSRMGQEMTLAENEMEALKQKKEVAKFDLARVDKELRESPPPPAAPGQPNGGPKGPLVDTGLTSVLTHDERYKRLTGQLLDLDFELKSPPRVTVIQPASAPSMMDGKKQLFGSIFAGLMGFALVAGVIVLLESRARKVSSLGELKGASQTPVVGVVPWMPDGATARDPLKRADVNEAIDKLRAYVVQTWLSRGASTVTVTSALGDEGKSFTAFGLASSLAQAGYKTLLVDFDLRNPSLHPYAGVPNAAGVCELLRGEADFRKTIQILPNGLHFLAAGKWSDDARQAAVGGRLEALLNRLKEPFDCVVLHGHALLTVAESVEVARRSEVVLLCALYRDTRAPMLKRAADRVASMEIPFSGIVYLGASPNEALC